MKRSHWALAGAAALAGCASGTTDPAPEMAGDRPMTCNAAGAQSHIGKMASQETGAAILKDSAARSLRWGPPRGAGVRVDSHCYDGYLVPPFYDSMIGKLIVTASTRAACVERLAEALDRCEIGGLTTNLPLLRHIARHPDFVHNHLNTRWLEKTGLPGFSAQQE